MSFDPFSSIRRMRRALDRKEISSVELTQLYLGRLKTLGVEHNAVAELTEEVALSQAKQADESPARSTLHGIPYGIKDLFATKGLPTRWGSPGHADQVFDFDATVVIRLRDAGAVMLGKLEMIELAGGGNYNTPDASRMGPCLSAWDKTRWAGGSSSGSGAATGLACVGFSIGTETAGSIVCPSAFNGVTGFRPTYGRVSRHGAMALCWSLDRIGPMARSVQDCGLVLLAIAGRDPADATTLSNKLHFSSGGAKPRIGILKETFAEANATAMEEAYHAALDVFRSQGYETVEVAYPDLPYEAAVNLIVDAEGASAHENFIRSDRFSMLRDVHQVAGFAAAMQTKAVDYLWAMRLRTEALKANSVWEKCDCIFTPSFYRRAVPIDQPFDQSFGGMGGDYGPSNLLGWPATAFPVGFEEGAPLGGQILAPCFREEVCYRVARDFQRATDWHERRPPHS